MVYALNVMEISKKEKLQALLEQEQELLNILIENKAYVSLSNILKQHNKIKRIKKEIKHNN